MSLRLGVCLVSIRLSAANKEVCDHFRGGLPEPAIATPDSPGSPSLSPDNELPLKKRKRRHDYSPAEWGSSETSSDSFYKDKEEDAQFSHQEAREKGNAATKCICLHLRKLEGTLSLFGKLNTWTKDQVHLWLWKTLRESNKGFSGSAICRTLQCISEDNGLGLSTYLKSDWRKKLDGCGVPFEFVYQQVCERLKDGPLRHHNLSEPVPLEEESTHHMNLYHNSNLSSGSEVTTAPKKRTTKPQRKRRDKCVGQLWEFVFNLLNNDTYNPSVVCWEDREKRLFRIVNTEVIASLWGQHKGNSNMTYANMSRTMRYYREGNGAFVRNERKRVYGFGPKADFDRLLAKSRKH